MLGPIRHPYTQTGIRLCASAPHTLAPLRAIHLFLFCRNHDFNDLLGRDLFESLCFISLRCIASESFQNIVNIGPKARTHSAQDTEDTLNTASFESNSSNITG